MRPGFGIVAATVLLLFCHGAIGAPDRIVVGNSAPFLDGERWLFEQTQIHFVIVARSSDSGNGTVNLRFGHFDHPATIILSSYTPVEWRLTGPVPAEIKAILLNRADAVVSGLPANLPVYRWRTDHWGERDEYLPCPTAMKPTNRYYPCKILDPVSWARDFHIENVERNLLFTEYRFLASYAISFAPTDIQVPGIGGGGRDKLRRVNQPSPYDRVDKPTPPLPDFSSRTIVDLDELRFQDFAVKLVYRYGPRKATRDCAADCTIPTDVVVPRSETPIVLVMSSYDEMKWHLLIEPGSQVVAIVLRNAAPSVLDDIDPRIPIWWNSGDRSVAREWDSLAGMARLFPGKRATLYTPPKDGSVLVVR